MELEKYIIFAGLLSSALFFFYFVLVKRIEKKGRIWITLGMVVVFYTFLYDFLIITENYQLALYFFLFYSPLIFSFYPIIYHYLVSAVNDRNERIIIKIFSFLPVIILFLTIFIYLPLSTSEKYLFIKNNFWELNSENSLFSFYQIVLYLLFYIQLIIFIVVFLQMYFIHKKRRAEIAKSKNLYLPKWLLNFILIIILYEIVCAFRLLIFPDLESSLVDQIANFVALLFVGFLGIKHDEMLLEMKFNSHFTKEKSSKNINLAESKVEEIIDTINKLMDESKLYLNPTLKLEHLAKRLHIPQKTLSEIINKHEGENYSQFINKFRINEAKQILSQNNKNLKINSIYLEVGFYSRSTFNRAFKTIEGTTPTEYIHSIK